MFPAQRALDDPVWQEVGLDDLQRSLPTPTILGFSDMKQHVHWQTFSGTKGQQMPGSVSFNG